MKLNIIPPVDKPVIPNKPKEDLYASPMGLWTVTTEGDCEGRSIKQLGAHYGHIAEIAFHLANQSGYSLQFKKQSNNTAQRTTYQATGTKVHVCLDSESDTWGMSMSQRAAFFRKLLDTDDVIVKEGQYYASVKLELNLKKDGRTFTYYYKTDENENLIAFRARGDKDAKEKAKEIGDVNLINVVAVYKNENGQIVKV